MSARTALEAAIRDRTAPLDAALADALPAGSPASLHAASRHLVEAGGKRLRPAVLLLVAEALDPDGDERGRLPAAVAVELVHTLSLVHDDVIDEDDLRRGVPSVHAAWDVPTAIVAGDLLYARAFALVGEVDAPADVRLACTRTLARACQRLSEGQARDLALAAGGPPTEPEYLRTVAAKTGALFEAAAELGARLAGADGPVARAAAAYGRALGVAFQLHDDVLDVTGSTATLGKPVGSDLAAGKPTLLTIHAREQGLELDPAAVEAGALGRHREALEAVGSLDYVQERADAHVATALAALEALPRSPARSTLEDLARFAVERQR